MPIIRDVNSKEKVTNDQGGMQSYLPYRFDLIPKETLFEIARVFKEGANTYGVDNWKLISATDHINHALSHIYAQLAGDSQDDHMIHALCRLFMADWLIREQEKGE